YAIEIDAATISVDIWFASYLRSLARFGYFSFGPVSIDANLIESIVEATTPRRNGQSSQPPMGDDVVRFSKQLMSEIRRGGRRRIDELVMLLAFMRLHEGLPARVFAELGVSPEQVEDYARNRGQEATLEKLFSPEEAAEYLNVHVQTVRTWIRTGRLRAKRLAGQRALRITASDLQSVLEPLDPDDLDPVSAKE
ncbi:MAG TPA: helix-turn-helix domain-containing protein, partial [Dehalococcoidia bacterium]|nr:helix-turn-helix domain-containing protein [Dehalococcoidia bacterium]